MAELALFIPGLPQPQGSARAFVVNGRAIVTSTNRNLKSWRQDAVSKIQDAWSSDTLTGEVSVNATFVFPRPKAHYNSKGLLKEAARIAPKLTAPDIDKLLRSLLDILTIAGVFTDDRLVTTVSTAKKYVDTSHTQPGVALSLAGGYL